MRANVFKGYRMGLRREVVLVPAADAPNHLVEIEIVVR
jgi:hypothetical protein